MSSEDSSLEGPESAPDDIQALSPEDLDLREQLMRQWPTWDWERR